MDTVPMYCWRKPLPSGFLQASFAGAHRLRPSDDDVPIDSRWNGVYRVPDVFPRGYAMAWQYPPGTNVAPFAALPVVATDRQTPWGHRIFRTQGLNGAKDRVIRNGMLLPLGD